MTNHQIQRAFPLIGYEEPRDFTELGMTMRQWYKGMAMLGLTSSDRYLDDEEIVERAVGIADLMVEEDKQDN